MLENINEVSTNKKKEMIFKISSGNKSRNYFKYDSEKKNCIILKYKFKEREKLNIFSEQFVKFNKNKCIMIVNNKKYKLYKSITIRDKKEIK